MRKKQQLRRVRMQDDPKSYTKEELNAMDYFEAGENHFFVLLKWIVDRSAAVVVVVESRQQRSV